MSEKKELKFESDEIELFQKQLTYSAISQCKSNPFLAEAGGVK
jgi:hypothetical protein